jgi:Helix-turn-helix domain
VPIGETLAAARQQAGLTVAEVSERTRIRPTIIRAIEDNDYTSCGGDFYARGNIRDMARVTGIDPEPLIREYDAAHRAPGAFSAVSLDELLTVSGGTSRRRPGRPATGERAAASGAAPRRWLSGAGDLVVVALTTVRLWLSRSAAGRAAASAPSAARRRLNWVVLLGVALMVALGFGVYRFLSSPRQTPVAPSAASNGTVTDHDATAGAPKPARKASPAASPAGTAPSPAAAVPSPAAAAPAQRLTPVSVSAFGPGGGDDPQNARLAISDHPGAGWLTDWYTTARFGNLYSGTGLLLDMGRPVTIGAVQIALGTARGASVQLRVGAAPALAALHAVAHKAGTAGVVRFRLASPARGRYVLIWFTRLPPDPAGTFRAEVWNVRLEGRS